ncbi:tryptophan--tRNA ligase [uncultured Xylophilus sp.]|uniref:tryptophan--tRNA ligase n=1 Tax=uncultured Xylophilus sp. TaxID=296832 RepID=UPI0025F990E6|nr:tryptophan--tRNA ligase [uncultured Xylophilus sp.]
MSIQRVLTGITTTGTPHLGNYVGAIRPAVRASREPGTESFYFLADYHALIKCDEPARIGRSTLEIAATWIASGLDPERVTFYRQSDIPEIPELCWLLTCVTGKGLLNRAHAYKAAVDRNTAAGQDTDTDVTAGLFMYPVLMGADILAFRAHKVPVGRDQIQHIEMARDMAASFNHLYGEHMVLPAAAVEESVALLPGLDGRKMSKSYHNTIPLFLPASDLKRSIATIVTDSRAPGEAKDTDGSALFQIFQAFASAEETAELRQAYADGIGWGDAKQRLFERIDREIAPLRDTYEALIARPERLEDMLQAGAAKARAIATPFVQELRQAVGLRPLRGATVAPRDAARDEKTAAPTFKQYREADGRFRFKLQDGRGQTVLQSRAYEQPREAAQVIAALQGPDADIAALVARAAEPAEPADLPAVRNALERLASSKA